MVVAAPARECRLDVTSPQSARPARLLRRADGRMMIHYTYACMRRAVTRSARFLSDRWLGPPQAACVGRLPVRTNGCWPVRPDLTGIRSPRGCQKKTRACRAMRDGTWSRCPPRFPVPGQHESPAPCSGRMGRYVRWARRCARRARVRIALVRDSSSRWFRIASGCAAAQRSGNMSSRHGSSPCKRIRRSRA